MACCNRQSATQAAVAVSMCPSFHYVLTHMALFSRGLQAKPGGDARWRAVTRVHEVFPPPASALLWQERACWLAPTYSHATCMLPVITTPAPCLPCSWQMHRHAHRVNTALSKRDNRDEAQTGCSKGTKARARALVGDGVVGEE